MEIGVCINMNASLSDGIGLEKLDIYKNAGFDYVEVPLVQVMALDDNQFQNAVFTLKEKGIKCKAC